MTKPDSYAGRRALATLIDYILVYAFTFWYIFTAGTSNGSGSYTVNGLPALVPVLFWFVYIVVVEAVSGSTLGHKISGLKVIPVTPGEALTFAKVLKRRLADILEISWCFGFVAFLIVQGTPRHQRLGDILAKTIVVDKNEPMESPEFDFEKSETES